MMRLHSTLNTDTSVRRSKLDIMLINKNKLDTKDNLNNMLDYMLDAKDKLVNNLDNKNKISM